jgi:hypothetical protein
MIIVFEQHLRLSRNFGMEDATDGQEDNEAGTHRPNLCSYSFKVDL